MQGVFNQSVSCALANGIGFVSHVESCVDFACNDVCGPRLRIDAANGRYQVWILLCRMFNSNDPLSSPGQRVAAKMHRRGASVIRPTQEYKFHASLSGDCLDSSKWIIERLENRSLLDVEFQVGQSVMVQHSAVQFSWAQPEILDGAAERCASGILKTQ